MIPLKSNYLDPEPTVPFVWCEGCKAHWSTWEAHDAIGSGSCYDRRRIELGEALTAPEEWETDREC